MTLTEDHVREMYARFGAAVYAAQVLEHGIVNAMVILHLPRREKFTKFDIDAFMDQQFENTLGKLIRNLKEKLPLPADLEQLLSKALMTRNWLCHHYFRERAYELLTAEGQEKMIAELQDAYSVLERADKTLTATVQPLADRLGLTQEAIQRELDSMKGELGIVA
jgi:hypothetical protein